MVTQSMTNGIEGAVIKVVKNPLECRRKDYSCVGAHRIFFADKNKVR